jgi:hypothetical protein
VSALGKSSVCIESGEGHKGSFSAAASARVQHWTPQSWGQLSRASPDKSGPADGHEGKPIGGAEIRGRSPADRGRTGERRAQPVPLCRSPRVVRESGRGRVGATEDDGRTHHKRRRPRWV